MTRQWWLAGLCGALLVICGCGTAKPDEVVCYPAGGVGWKFYCEVTGKGEQKADTPAPIRELVAAVERREDPNRLFQGHRWQAVVMIDKTGGQPNLEVGRRYHLYGTVKDIDGKTVRMTDCVFINPQQGP